jgi:putrescine transport system substrate-binding protein
VSVSDPGNKHAFPYMWGSIGIGYNPEKVKAALGVDKIDSGTLFKPENIAKLKLRRELPRLADRNDPGGAALPGLPTDSQKKEDLKKAEDLFLKIRPSIAYFHSSKYISDLANGNICVAVGYSGDMEQAKSRAAEAGDKVKVQHSERRCRQLLRHGRHP